MAIQDAAAVLAVLTAAVAILPGTLGILTLTNRIAASARGARFIYSQAALLIAIALALAAFAIYRSSISGSYSAIVIGATTLLAMLLLYGFLMHAKMLFRPIRNPVFISGDAALGKFGPEEEVVGVIDEKGKPFAFVARLARRPHIVFQPEGEAPFIMTHCILAHSSMSYALRGNFSSPDITITAALANNMVFYEKSNRCSVVQIHNRLEGRDEPLATVPTVMTSLGTWLRLYPESPVWMRPVAWRDIFYLKLLARAEVIDPASPVMVYPLEHDLDQRLPMKSLVLGVVAGDQARAYPVDVVSEQKAVNDELGGLPLAVFAADDFMQVFERRLEDGTVLTFSAADDRFEDAETGTSWSVTGHALDGPLAGTRLSAVPHYNKIFWFVWSDYHPRCEIFGDASSPPAARASAA